MNKNDSELVERIDDVNDFLSRPGRYHTSSGHEAFTVVEALSWHPRVYMGERLAFPEGEVQFFEVRDKPVKPNAAEMEGWGTESDYYERRLLNYDRWELAWWREVIQNARDAKGPGAPDGPTKIELECREDTFTDPETGDKVPAMLCVCRDNGTGMDAETLRKAFFTRGGSVKPAGSVGGFGDAKELILTPWLGYEVRSRDNIARGRHEGLYRPGIESGQPRLQGTEVKVWMPMGRATTANYAVLLIERCLLKGVRVTLNGEKLDASLTGGNLVLDRPIRLGDDATIGRLLIHHQARSQRRGVYVRANGVFMFEISQFEGNFKGIVYVDVNAPPRQVFTTKRDQLAYSSTARDDVYGFLSELAVDPKTRLKKERAEKNKIRQLYKGSGALDVREGLAAEIAAGVAAKTDGKLFKERKKSDDLVVLSEDVVVAVLDSLDSHARNPALAGDKDEVDLSPSRAAADVILRNVSFMNVEQITSAIHFAAWKPDFFIYQNLDFWRMPSKLAPSTMAPKYQKLIRLYAELCKFALAQVGEFAPFGVGWVFDTQLTDTGMDTVGGMHTKQEGRSWLLLNPLKLKITTDGDQEMYEDLGDQYDLSRDADIETLCAVVLHEVTHLQGFSKHDQAYATQLTYNIRIALRGMMGAAKKLLKITSSAVREESRERKEAKAAVKHASWKEVVGSIFYLLLPWDGADWQSRRDLANVTPSVGGGSAYLDDQLKQMRADAFNDRDAMGDNVRVLIDTPEAASAYINRHWPTTKRYGGLDPLKPKQLVTIYDSIRRLGIQLPSTPVLEDLADASMPTLPPDPRARLTAPSGVYTWTKDGERWVLRAGYVGQRGDKLAELLDSDTEGWRREDFETFALRKTADAKYVFTPKRRQTPKEWALAVPGEGGYVYVDAERDGAWITTSDLRMRTATAITDLGKFQPSVAVAQQKIIEAMP